MTLGLSAQSHEGDFFFERERERDFFFLIFFLRASAKIVFLVFFSSVFFRVLCFLGCVCVLLGDVSFFFAC